VAREISGTFRGTPARLISPSTLSGMRQRRTIEGDGVLQMLRWLGRSPESFLADRAGESRATELLPQVGPSQILRFDTRALYAALDARREERGMSWRQVADEIDAITAASLTRVSKDGRIGFPDVMRIVACGGCPAVTFYARVHSSRGGCGGLREKLSRGPRRRVYAPDRWREGTILFSVRRVVSVSIRANALQPAMTIPEIPEEPMDIDGAPHAAALRGFGPLGILAVFVILLGGLVPPTGALLVLVWVQLSRTPWREIGYVRPKNWIRTIVVGMVFGVAFKFLLKAIVMRYSAPAQSIQATASWRKPRASGSLLTLLIAPASRKRRILAATCSLSG
jgi:hypothetical protein